MKGLSWQSLKSNYSLIPLFSVVTLGMVMAAGQSLRSLMVSTDVKVNRGSEDRPWDAQLNRDGSFKHVKYVQLNDYSKIKKSEYEPDLEK